MTWLFEEPLPILFVGVTVEAILAAVLVQTGQRAVLGAMVGTAVLFGGLLLLEKLVETETELVERTLDTIVRDLKKNDVDAVLEHISSQAVSARERLRTMLPQAAIDDVKIKSNLEIMIRPELNPPMAVARFNAVFVGSYRGPVAASGRYPVFLVVTLFKEEGRWKIGDYERHNPQKGL